MLCKNPSSQIQNYDRKIHHKKLVTSLCPTTVPQLSFPLFIHTLAPWCLSFLACFTDDQRQASIKKSQTTKHDQKSKEPAKPQNTWSPNMNNKMRKNYCRDLSSTFFSMRNYTWHSLLAGILTCIWNGKQWELLGYANISAVNRGKERKDEQRANKAMTQIVRPT